MNSALDWLMTLIGTPYVWWMPSDSVLGDCGPFWWSAGPVPAVERIRQEGCNCAGLMNLLFRKLGRVPLGTTVEWFAELEGVEQRTAEGTDFEEGTILLRPYSGPEDQGHIAMVLSGGRLLHCYPSTNVPRRGLDFPGIAIDESWKISDCWVSKEGGYYTHVCRPGRAKDCSRYFSRYVA